MKELKLELIQGNANIKYWNTWNARISTFAFSLVLAVHHELLPGQYMLRHIKYIKGFTRLRESGFIIYAGNAKMFSAE